VLLICIGTGVAFAGGGNGSEVLGPVKEEAGADKSTLMDSVKKMLSKGHKESSDESADADGGEQRRKPGEARSEDNQSDKDKNQSNKKNSKNKDKNSKDGDSDSDKGAKNSTDGSDKDKNNGKKQAKNDDGFPMDCVVTPSLYPDNIPIKKIKKGNNLMRKPGAARRANGQYVEIIGKVVDEDCVPISDAEVQIWQADASGKYEDDYTLKSEWDVLDKGYDKNFGYSGAAQTNNLGEFSFLTILPNMKNDLAPHINFYVRHPDFRQAATMMFFDKHPKNDSDKNLKTLKSDERQLLIANGRKLDPKDQFEGRVYGFMITLGGMNKYRRY
jgi:protocatechuate 3,4-dioxygenase beta subunit